MGRPSLENIQSWPLGNDFRAFGELQVFWMLRGVYVGVFGPTYTYQLGARKVSECRIPGSKSLSRMEDLKLGICGSRVVKLRLLRLHFRKHLKPEDPL